jgi:tetratricopeptide (TPR) repeat protein
MAPERFQGQADARSEVYSLGLTLYEMLTLRPAFEDSNRARLVEQVLRAEPPRPRSLDGHIPRDLELITLKAMAKSPAERYTTARELADDLERFLNDEPIRAKRPGWAQRLRKWARRHKPVVWTATAAFLTMGAVLAGFIGRNVRDQAARRAQIMAEADQAFQDSERLRALGKWSEARAALQRARAVLASGAGDAGQRQQAEDLLADLELAARLDTIRAGKDMAKDAAYDLLQADRDFGQAFRKFGIDVEELGPEAAAERIRARSIRVELAMALDDWAMARRWAKLDPARWKPLLAVAQKADPDPVRSRLRDALAGNNREGVEKLAAPDKITHWPASTFSLLGSNLLYMGSVDKAVAVLRQAQQKYPGDFWINHDLGACLLVLKPPRAGEAARFLTAAVATRPENPVAYYNLGNALKRNGSPDQAIAAYREALRWQPTFAPAHNNLGNVLRERGFLDQAIAEFEKALRHNPDHPFARFNRGLALQDQGKLDEAIAAFQEAIRHRRRLKEPYADAHNALGKAYAEKGLLDRAIVEIQRAIHLQPNSALAHYNLGLVFRKKGLLDKAVAEYRQAIHFRPAYADAYNNLGFALEKKGLIDQAIAEYWNAIYSKPNDAVPYNNLGAALAKKGQLDGAIAAYKKAIALAPNYATAHHNLGLALEAKQELDGAIAEFKKAIALDPKYAAAHSNLGLALKAKGDLKGAIAAYKQAISLDPKDASAHGALGQALLGKGRFAEARTATRKALDLLPPAHPLRNLATRQLRQCEHWLKLDARLPAVLQGDAEPADAREQLALAYLCQQYKQRYAAAARFYSDAFSNDTRLADDLQNPHRYNAACAAAVAGAGRGKDAANLDDKERARLRRQALDWLRADLAAYHRLLDKEPAKARLVIKQRMQHWWQDADFSSVRGNDALGRLPEAERRAWRQLWDDVAALRKQAGD